MTLLEMAADLGGWIVLAAAALTFVRLAIGPTVADRAVALDTLTVLMVAFAGLRAISTGVAAYLDVAVALALTAFLGTLAFARFIARRGRLPGDK